MAVGITLLEKYDGDPRNSLILFDRSGERKFTYAKVHTCDFDVERNLTPGEDCILQADGGEGVYLAELDLDQLRAYRAKEVHGNAYRRPKKYGILTDTAICGPFARSGCRE